MSKQLNYASGSAAKRLSCVFIILLAMLSFSSITSPATASTVTTPTITPNGGNYAGTVSVSLETPTPKAVIYYTTNGQSPTQKSIRYTQPFVLSTTTVLKAKAFRNNFTPSSVASAWFTNTGINNFSFSLSNSGNVSVTAGASGSNSITAALTSGSAQTVSFSVSGLPSGATASFSSPSCSPGCSTALNINTTSSTPAGTSTIVVSAAAGSVTTTTSFSLAVSLPTVATPTLTPNGGTYSGSVSVSMQTATSGASIYYTTDGSAPTQSSKLYAGTITLANSALLKAAAFKTGYNPSPATSASFTVNQATLDQGLVAYWKFDEGSGATAGDASGNGNTGTLTSGASWTSGMVGKALYFDGTSGSVVVPDANSLQLSNAFTLSAWVNPSATFSDFRAILVKNYSYYFYGSASGYCGNGASLGGFSNSIANVVCESAPLPINTWSHVTVTYDGSTITYYLNGIAVGTAAASGPLSPTTGTLQIGASQYGEFFKGLIDELRLYNTALSGTEIQALYQQDSLYQMDQNLMAYWKFDEGSGTTAGDASGNGNTGTLTSGASWTSGVVGKALYFDGTSGSVVVPDANSLQLSNAFTLSAWVNPSATFSDFRAILVKNYSYYLYGSASGYCGNGASLGGFSNSIANVVCESAPLPINTWSHVTVTYDGSTITYYLNGIAVGTAAASGPLSPTTGTLQIGASQYGEFFKGLIDELRLYNTALTATGVQALYRQNALQSVFQSASSTGTQPFNFSLSNSGNVSMTAGSSASNSISASLTSGATQAISFSVSGLPSGVTASFSSASCSPACSTTLNISASASTPAGTSAILVTAAAAGITKTTSFNLSVGLPTVATPTINPNGGTYTGSVSVSMQTATAGASIYYTTDGSAPTQSSKLYMGSMTLTNSALVKAAAFKTGYNVSPAASASFTVTQPFNFSLSNAGNVSVAAGSSASTSITASLSSGVAQSVSFSISGLPTGTIASFSAATCSPVCSTTVTISTTSATPAANSTITVTATGGGGTASTAFTLAVTTSLAVTNPIQSVPAWGTTYYVSPTGSGTTCSSGAPCAISQIGAAAVAQPGDLWVLKNGTYSSGIQVNCSAGVNNGTAGAPIRVQAENERQAFLDTHGNYGIKIYNCAYWQFVGLHIRQGDNASYGEDVVALLGSGTHHITLRRNLIEKPNRLGITTGWSAILVYMGSNTNLIEENEIYGCWANCVNLHGSHDDEVRRNYCNNAINWDAGLNNPAACFTIYPGENELIENNICESVDACLDIEPAGDSLGNKLLGNIAFNVLRNVMADRGSGTYAIDTIIRDDILLVGSGSPYNTWAFGNTRNTQVTGATWINLNGGSSPNAGVNVFGDGNASFALTNGLIRDFTNTYGLTISGQSSWAVSYTDAFNNAVNFNPQDSHVTAASTVPTTLNGCVVFIPVTSNLHGAGLAGADIGANVLYAYEGGSLTTKPLWSGSTKKWQFAGAIVSGVNDTVGLANIETRLHPNCTSWPY